MEVTPMSWSEFNRLQPGMPVMVQHQVTKQIKHAAMVKEPDKYAGIVLKRKEPDVYPAGTTLKVAVLDDGKPLYFEMFFCGHDAEHDKGRYPKPLHHSHEYIMVSVR